MLDLFQQSLQHHVLLLQLSNLPALLLLPFLQLLYSLPHSIHLLHSIPLLLLVQFCTLTVPAHALALFTVAPLISIEGTLIEKFSHFCCVEISARLWLAPQMTHKTPFLKK